MELSLLYLCDNSVPFERLRNRVVNWAISNFSEDQLKKKCNFAVNNVICHNLESYGRI